MAAENVLSQGRAIVFATRLPDAERTKLLGRLDCNVVRVLMGKQGSSTVQYNTVRSAGCAFYDEVPYTKRKTQNKNTNTNYEVEAAIQPGATALPANPFESAREEMSADKSKAAAVFAESGVQSFSSTGQHKPTNASDELNRLGFKKTWLSA